MLQKTHIACEPAPDPFRDIRLWLWIVAAGILAMVVVGGATRLTKSGLSITEWKPVTGVVPPLHRDEWREAFEKYQQIPQYRRTLPRYGPRPFQDHLFVGMEPSAARAVDRRRVRPALPVVSVAWKNRRRPALAAGRHFCVGRAARFCWLVDGVFGPRQPRRGGAGAAGDSPPARQRCFCRRAMDGGGPRSRLSRFARPQCGAPAQGSRRDLGRGPDPDRPGRSGRRPARRPRL